ncbi:putative F-box protein SKIP23-like [Capsicum annuum]|uniref:Pseudouridine synthase I TruA alpha/beta domain-containing protein n=1 Tax=Capsicum annuum TaxID=4072 RepID=A0A2G2ZMN7_CAPAN|nr:putative F-box protein SKIP23-like [Capsicum annuum]KAF3643676.1 putative F-box protein SKIP23-like [Capsicum annuum]PHT83252.1 hypothetical protein T459_11695 [Capsicum annuum]
MSTSYSMWSVILVPYNLPPWKSFKDPFMMMSLFILGLQASGKDINVYLHRLVDELKELWSDGVETFDASSGECFKIHAAILWTINDFPAYDMSYVQNLARPKGSIVEGYIIDECLIFSSMYLDDIETRFNRKDRNDDGSSNNDGPILEIFSKSVRPYKVGDYDAIPKKDFDLAQWYVLNNCKEAEPFLEKGGAQRVHQLDGTMGEVLLKELFQRDGVRTMVARYEYYKDFVVITISISSGLTSLRSGNELVKCLYCLERGHKVIAAMGKHFYDPKIKSVIFVDAPTSEGNMVIENGDFLSKKVKKRNDESPKVVEERVQESVFIYGEKEKERFNQILKYYEGTHNFHNFTRRKKDGDPVAKRYILSFNANIIVNVQGIEFMKCEVTGQNFMLHTIHKMIGLAESIMRNYAPESLIITAFQRDVNIKFPMAPEVGLYLDECFFTSYNSKWKDTQEEVSLTAYLEMAEEFKMKHIYSHIAIMEHKEGTMGVWLHYLNHQNYPDLRVVDLVKPADDGLEVVETAIDVGLGVFNNCERTNNVNSTGASDGPDITKTIMEAGLSAANNGERIDNIDSAGAILEVTETIVQADLGSINNGAINNGKSTDTTYGEARRDADLVDHRLLCVQVSTFELARQATLRMPIQEVFSGEYKMDIIDFEGVLRFDSRIYILRVDSLIQLVLRKAHSSRYSIHPGEGRISETRWLDSDIAHSRVEVEVNYHGLC